MSLPPVIALAAALATPATTASPVPVHVEAAQVQYNNKDGKVVFLGAPLVRVTREDAVLLCRRLVADNDEEGHIRHAVCTGDVKLTRGEKVVTCQKATFENAISKVVCIGNPVLRDGRSVMHGTELTYDIAEDRVILTQAHGTVIPRGNEIARKTRTKEASP
jgi:lipopolysaccharide transport protein LptA